MNRDNILLLLDEKNMRNSGCITRQSIKVRHFISILKAYATVLLEIVI